jgi:valyl-tRNA synthetase
MVEDTRNFANKIWNAARFVRMNLGEAPAPATVPDKGALGLADRWILSRFAQRAAAVTQAMEGFEFREVCQHLYDFIWSEFCDWYLEMAKQDLREPPVPGHLAVTRAVLSWTLAETMKLLHPVMPSLTEEIWQALPHEGRTIMRAPWPAGLAHWRDPDAESQMAVMMDVIRGVRGIRADLGVPPGDVVPIDLFAPAEQRRALEAAARYIAPLSRARTVRVHSDGASRPRGGFSSLSGTVEIRLGVESGEAAEPMRMRLRKQLAAVARDLAGLDGRLQSTTFLERAPAEVVAADRLRRDELEEKRAMLERYLHGLGT